MTVQPPVVWISESDRLPEIAQQVLLITPRQAGEFWNVSVACLLVRHEGVSPRPVAAGSSWPTDYWWSSARDRRDTQLITGNGWWSSLASIPLPDGAVHQHIRGYDVIAQIGEQFVSQARLRG